MDVYLVGGAVRDELLGLPVADRDWVVVGSTPDTMLEAGYKAVGQDFPVFLHPETHEEYALARTERKTGPGYRGFIFNTDDSVTLEQDLSRRDLTINAIARQTDGKLVDPYAGRQDIEQRVLRHVSPAFVEDPVRVLRVAKFMARFAHLGFQVADSTLELMQEMVTNGETDNLVPERVWQELVGALGAPSPRAFIETLRECNALGSILPEVDCLFGVPQRAEFHPEVDSGIHTLMVLDQACMRGSEPEMRFAALCHDLGKGTTTAHQLPSHTGHENRGADITASLCERLRAPKRYRDMAVLTARYHTQFRQSTELKPGTLLRLLQALDVSRKPDRFEQFLVACESDLRGRTGFEHEHYPQASYLRGLLAVFNQVDAASIARKTENKADIPEAIRIEQLKVITSYVREYRSGNQT